MKLLIDIPEEIVTAIQNGQDYRYDIHTAIAQGKPYGTSGDLISREALKKKFGYTDEWYKSRTVAHAIDNAPTVDVRDRRVNEMDMWDFRMFLRECIKLGQYEELVKILREENIIQPEERPKGEWIDTGSGQECNVCHEIQYGYDSFRYFCPNCGSNMRGKEE